MKEKTIQLLTLANRPSRYINGEVNSHPSDMSADFSIVLCFPDIYEIGASNLGLEILYHLINEKKLARCERCFAPDLDMEELLRRRQADLFSLESGSPLKSFDIIGFSIQCEMSASNIINMIDLAFLPHFAKDRKDGDPLIIGGGPALTNPEPFSAFFDFFLLGEAEEAIVEIIEVCRKYKKIISRKELLIKLSQIEGVYIPSLFNISYKADNTIDRIENIAPQPLSDNIMPQPLSGSAALKPVFKSAPLPIPIKKRSLNLNSAYFPSKKIIPFTQTVHDRLNIEVARGCPGACRFCQASKFYYPFRQRPVDNLIETAKKSLANSGYEEISFSSLSCGDYKDLDKLILETDKIYEDSRLSISLPSLRCNERSLKIIQYINRAKKPSLTLAPEAGTDRLRNVIGKYLSGAQILKTLISANKMGWNKIKLYFMIGLPTETDDDIDGIIALIKTVKSQAKNLNFNITISPFVPKSHTAFQWHSMLPSEKIKEKIDYLHKKLPACLKPHNSKTSLFEALIAKGDRRVSSVIYSAWKAGARFDQWADRFNVEIWEAALKENNLDLDFYVFRQRGKDEIFPWDHLNFGVSKEKLYEDYLKGLNESAAPVSTPFDLQDSALSTNCAQQKKESTKPEMKARLQFSKCGKMRFISHLEQIEVFRRALRRANLPIAFTEGFSPNVKASFSFPLPVGYESLCEYMEVCFTEKIPLSEIKEKVSKVLPDGFKLLEVKGIPLFFPSIDVLANLAQYRIYGMSVSQKEIDAFLSEKEIKIIKEKNGQKKEIDIRPLIKSMEIDGKDLILIMHFSKDFYVKADLVIERLMQGRENADYEKIERSALYIETSDGQRHIP